MLGRTTDLEDLVQEVFLQVHRSLPSFRAESRLSTWIYRVTVNVALMHRRAAKNRPAAQLAEREPQLHDDAAPPDEQLARRRRVEALYRLLDRMSDKKRTVYVLHEIEGLAPTEISRIVGAPVLTVRTRLFYARREVLAALHDEPALSALTDELSPPSADRSPAAVHEPHKEPA